MTYNSAMDKVMFNTWRLYQKQVLPKVSFLRGTTWLNKKLKYLSCVKEEDEFTKVDFKDYSIKYESLESWDPVLYERPFVDFILDNEIDIFVDVGAYCGFYTVLARHEASKAIGFEMSGPNLEKVRQNIDVNSLENIELVNKALWSSKTTLEADIESEGLSSINKGSKEVETTTLDDVFEQEMAPDVIKIDVEGAELEVLKGGNNLLSSENPVILLELHKKKRLKDFDHSPQDVVDFLTGRGYSCNKVKEEEFDDLYICR